MSDARLAAKRLAEAFEEFRLVCDVRDERIAAVEFAVGREAAEAVARAAS